MSAPRRRPPQRLGELLPRLAATLGLDEQLRAAQAMTAWSRIVEELAPAVGPSHLIEVRPPLVVASAVDAAGAQELRLNATRLLHAFAQAPGGTRALELRVVVRPPRLGESERPR